MSCPPFEVKETYSVWQKRNVRTIVVNAHAKNLAQRSIVSAMGIAKPYNRIELVGGEYLEPLSISIPLEFVGSEGEEPQIVSRSRAVTVTSSCRVYFENVTILSKSKQKDGEAVGILDGQVFFEKCKLSSLIVGAKGYVSMEKCYIQRSPAGIGLAVREEGSGVLRDCTIHSHFHKCMEMNTVGTFLIENCSIYNKRKDGGDLFVAAGSGSGFQGKIPSCGRVTLSQSRLYISADNGNPESGKGGKAGPSAVTERNTGYSPTTPGPSALERESYMVGDPCCVVITNGAAPTIKQNILLEGDIGILLYQAGHATLTKNTIQYQRRGGILALLPKLPQPRCVSGLQSSKVDDEDENGFSGLKIMGNNVIDHCFIGIDIHTKRIPKLSPNTDSAILESCTFSPNAGGVEPFSWLSLPDVASTKAPSSSSVASVTKVIKENEAIEVPVHGTRVNAHELQYQLRVLVVMVLQIFRWCLSPEFGKRPSAVPARVSAASNGNYFANQLLHSLGLNVHEALTENNPSSISSMVEKISISSTIFNRCGLCAIRFGHLSYGSVEHCTFDENFRHAIIVGSGACPIITGCTFIKSSHSAILVGGYANPLVVGNHVVDGEKNGIEVTTQGRGIYMSNYIATSAESGIEVSNGSDPLICANMIKRNAGGGIKVGTSSSPVIYLNVLSVNSMAQIRVGAESHPFIVRNSIQSGLGVGMLFTSSRGVVRKNHVISNKLGILVEKRADPEIAHNIIEKNDDTGITVRNNGLGTFFLNDIVYNGTNVIIADGGDCVMRANNISKGAQGGIVVRQKGKGVIEKNQLRENGVVNLLIADWESHALCSCNCITGSPGCGVIVACGGEGLFTNNQIFENSYCGVYVLTEGNPYFRENRISREAVGILVSESGKGVFEQNSIQHIYGIGLIVQRKGAPFAKENQFSTCDLCAIQIGRESSGRLERNSIVESFFGIQIGTSFSTEELDIASAYFSPQMDAAPPPHRVNLKSGGESQRAEIRSKRHPPPSLLPPSMVLFRNDVTENHVAGVLLQCTVNCRLEENQIYKNKIFGILGDATYWDRQDEDDEGEADLKLMGGTASTTPLFLKLSRKPATSSPNSSVIFAKNRIYQHSFANVYFPYFQERGVKLVENAIFDSPVGIAILRKSRVEETTGNIIHHCLDGIQVMKGGKGCLFGNHILHCSRVGLYISEGGSPDFKSGNKIEYCRLCGVLCDVGASGEIRQSTIRQCQVGVWVMCSMDTSFQHLVMPDKMNAPSSSTAFSEPLTSSSSAWYTTSVIEENFITENLLHGVVLLATTQQEPFRPIPECSVPICSAWKKTRHKTPQQTVKTPNSPLSKSLLSHASCIVEFKSFPSVPLTTRSERNVKFSKNVVKHNRVCGFYMDRVDCSDMDPSLKTQFSIQEKSSKATSDAILGTSMLGTSREHLDERSKQQPYLIENQIEGCTVGVSVGACCHPLMEQNVLKNNLFFGLLLRPHSAAMICGGDIIENGLAGVYACNLSKGTLCDSLIAHNRDKRLLQCADRPGGGKPDFFLPTTTLATVLITWESELKKQMEKYKKGTTSVGKITIMPASTVGKKAEEDFLFFPQENWDACTSPTSPSPGFRWLTEAAEVRTPEISGKDELHEESGESVNGTTRSSSKVFPKHDPSMLLFKWLGMQNGVMASVTSVICDMIVEAGGMAHNMLLSSEVLPPQPFGRGMATITGRDLRYDKYGFLPSTRPSPRQVNLLEGGVGVWAEQGSRTTLRQNSISDHHQVGVFMGTGMCHIFTQLQDILKNSREKQNIHWWNTKGEGTTGNAQGEKKFHAAEPSAAEIAMKALTGWNSAAMEISGMQTGDLGRALHLLFTTDSSSFFVSDEPCYRSVSNDDPCSPKLHVSPSFGDLVESKSSPLAKTSLLGPGERPTTSGSFRRVGSYRKAGGGGGNKAYAFGEGKEFQNCIVIEKNHMTRNKEGMHIQVLHTMRAVAKTRSAVHSPSTASESGVSRREDSVDSKKSTGILRVGSPIGSMEGGSKKEVKIAGVNKATFSSDSRPYGMEAVAMVRNNRIFENTKVGVYTEHLVEVQCQDVLDSAEDLWNMVVSTSESRNIIPDWESHAGRFSQVEAPLVDPSDYPFVLAAPPPSSRRSAVICQNEVYGNRQVQAEATSQYIVVSKDQARTLLEMDTFCDPANASVKLASSQVLYRVPVIAALFQRSVAGTIHFHNNHFHDSLYGLRCFGVLWADSVRVYQNQFVRFQKEALGVLGHLAALTVGPKNVFHDNQIAVQINVDVPKKDLALSKVLDFETKVFKCVFSAQRQQSIRIAGVSGTPALVELNTFTGHGEGSVAMLLLTPSVTSLFNTVGGAASFTSVVVSNNKFTYNYLPVVVMGEEVTTASTRATRDSGLQLQLAASKEEKDAEKNAGTSNGNATATKNEPSPTRPSFSLFPPSTEKAKPASEQLIIAHNEFSCNVIGALICNGATLRLAQNRFVGNSRAGIEITGVLTCPVIEECIFRHNSNLHPYTSEEVNEREGEGGEKKKPDSPHSSARGRFSRPFTGNKEGNSGRGSPATPHGASPRCSLTRYTWNEDQKEVILRGVPLPIPVSVIHRYPLEDTHHIQTLSCGILLNPGSQCTVNRCLFGQNDVGVDTVRCMLVSKDEKLALFTNSVFENHYVAGVMVRYCESARIRESAALLTRGSFPKETTRFESNFFVDNAYDSEKGIGDVVGREFGTAVFRGNLFCGTVHGMENAYIWLDNNYFLPESANTKSAEIAVVLHRDTKLMGTKNIIGKRKVGIEALEDSIGFLAENIVIQCSTGIRSLFLSKTRFSKNRILGSASAAMVVYSGEFDENEVVFSKDGILVKDVTTTKATHVIVVNRRHEGKAKLHRNRLYACEKEGIVVGTPAEVTGNMIQDSSVGIHLIPFHTKVDREHEDEWNLVRSNFVLMNYIGVLVEEKAMTLIKDNDIFDNTSVGVSVEANACGVLQGNRISTVKDEDAVVISSFAKLRVANNTIRHRFSPVFNRVPHNCRYKEMGAFMQAVVDEMEEYNKGWEEMVNSERQLEKSLSHLDTSSLVEAPSPSLLLDPPSPPALETFLQSGEHSTLSIDILVGAPTLELRRRKASMSLEMPFGSPLTVGSPGQLSSMSASVSFPNNNANRSASLGSSSSWQVGSRELNKKEQGNRSTSFEPHSPSSPRVSGSPHSSVLVSRKTSVFHAVGAKKAEHATNPSTTSHSTAEQRRPSTSTPSMSAAPFSCISNGDAIEERIGATKNPDASYLKSRAVRPSLSHPSHQVSSTSTPVAPSASLTSVVREGDWRAPRRFVLPSTPSTAENSLSGTLTGGTNTNTLISRARESAISNAQAVRQKEAEKLKSETTPLLLHILTRSSGQKEAEEWGNALAKLLTKPPLDKIHFRVFVSTSKEALCHTMEENPPEVLLLLAHPSCSGPSSPLEREVLSLLHNAAINGGKGGVGGSENGSNTFTMQPPSSTMKKALVSPTISPRPHRLASSIALPKFILGLFSEKQIEEDRAFSKETTNASIASLLEGSRAGGPGASTQMSLSTFSAAHRTLMYTNTVRELHSEVVYILQNECQAKKKSPRPLPPPLLTSSSFGSGSTAASGSPYPSSTMEEIHPVSPSACTPSKSAFFSAGGIGDTRRKTIEARSSVGEERRFTLEDVAQLMSLIDPKSTVDPKEERRKRRKKKKEEKQPTSDKLNDEEEEREGNLEEDPGEAEKSLLLSKELVSTSSLFDATLTKNKIKRKIKAKPSQVTSPGRRKTVVSHALKRLSNVAGEAKNVGFMRSTSLISADLSRGSLQPLGEEVKKVPLNPQGQ